jgi:peroxiredoxin
MNATFTLPGHRARASFVLSLILCGAASCALAADSLRVGDPAPEFALPWASMDSVSSVGLPLREILQHGAALLAFYPADWSGGCTREMCAMRDNFSSFGTLGVAVYGISGDYVHSHREWAKSLNLPFVLLSDHDHAVARLYESYNTTTGYNKRTVFLIDQHGKIAYLDRSYKVNSPDSFENLIIAVKSLR